MGGGVKEPKRGSREPSGEAVVQGSNEGVLAWGGGGPCHRGSRPIIQAGKRLREYSHLPQAPSRSAGGYRVGTAVSGQALLHFTTINCSLGKSAGRAPAKARGFPSRGLAT